MLHSHNPATGELIGGVPIASASDITNMVNRARRSQKSWARDSLEERANYLHRALAELAHRSDDLARLITREMGKPIAEARAEVQYCAEMQWKLDELVAALQPQVVEDSRLSSTVYFQPLGVVAAITPWNFPVMMPHMQLLPALMAGNAIVLKPSEETPLTAQAYADILIHVLPDDVLQVAHGADDQGKALVAADVDLIAFTGSRETGKKILKSAAGSLKRVVLELGGKDPLIVLKDADVEKAARFAANSGFRNAGQVCVSTERVFVDAAIADKFEASLAKYALQFKLGPGDQQGVTLGPMINAQQRSHVLEQLDQAMQAGARVITGHGNHPERFVNPTVLVDVPPDASIMQEETFGPVLCVNRFETDEEAIEWANNTPFGLGAAVFGEHQHARAVGERIEAGMVGVNQSCHGAQGTPWVGAKQSGYGFHSSPDGHRQFAQRRVVSQRK